MSKYITDKDLMKRYDISRATVWRWSKAGLLPKPVKLNGSTRWDIEALEKFDKGRSIPPSPSSKSIEDNLEEAKRFKEEVRAKLERINPTPREVKKEDHGIGAAISVLENQKFKIQKDVDRLSERKNELSTELNQINTHLALKNEELKGFNNAINRMKNEAFYG